MSNHSSTPDSEIEKWALPRRDFLVLGSAAAFSVAASSVTASTLRMVAAPAAGSILSVGYTERTAPVDVSNNAFSVVPAKNLRVSDGSFRHSGARVLVHGLSSPAKSSEQMAVRLSTFAPAAGGAVPFLAWSHTTDQRGRAFTSPRVSFIAALDESGTLPISIERSEPAGRWSRRFLQALPATTVALPDLAKLEQSGNVCRLSSGDAGDVRLRAGTYFIALRRSSSDRQPDWRSIDVDPAVKNASDALRRNGAPVGFDYVAVTIDYPVA
jgi:hypothetical protein